MTIHSAWSRAGMRGLIAGTALVLAACSGGGDDDGSGGGALLDPGNLGGGSGNTTNPRLVLDCPTDVLAGKLTSGFTARLTNASGQAIRDVFVGLKGFVGETPEGRVVANKPAGGTNLGGANTGTDGRVAFSFEPGVNRTTAATAEIRGLAKVSSGSGSSATITEVEATCEVTISPNPAKLRLTGPGGAPTGSLELEAGEAATGFSARIVDSVNTPIPEVELTLSAKNDNGTNSGRIRTTSGLLTDGNGEVFFDYVSASTIAAETVITIKAEGFANGKTLTANYLLTILPPPPEPLPPTITITGPTTAESGEIKSGYVATVVDEDNQPVAGFPLTFAALDASDDTAGSILSQTGSGLPPPTNALGEVRFRFSTPRLATAQNINLTASGRFNNAVVSSEPLRVRVDKLPLAKMTLEGPASEPTGSLEVESGTLVSGFVLTLLDGRGNPIDAEVLDSLTTSAGNLLTPDGLTTDADGQVVFDLQAPTVTTATTVTLAAAANEVDDTTNDTSATYTLRVVPPPPPPAPILTLTGPQDGSPNQERTGYTAELLREDGQAIENALVQITAGNGTVTVIENGTPLPGSNRGRTDAFGRLAFTFTPASNAAETTVTLTGSVATGSPAALLQQCQTDTEAACTDTLNVAVRADTFQFTSPQFGAAAVVGLPNAVPLTFSWVTAAGDPVPACVDLTTTFTGSGNATFGMIITGDPTPRTQIRRVLLDSTGDFLNDVSVFSDRSGFLEVKATENRDCDDTPGSATASTGLQFNDEPGDANNHVDLTAPLRVFSSPDAGGNQRRGTLTFEVRNNAFEPIDNAQVLFTISTSAGGFNERVFPGGGTTNASGIATSQYFVPSFDPALVPDDPTTAADESTSAFVEITACVRSASSPGSNDGQVCSTRRIDIIAEPAD